MTAEEYQEQYLAHVKALGMALQQEMTYVPIEKAVKQGLIPVHVGVQAAVSEINALVHILVNKEIITKDEYREAVLQQLTYQREIVLSRLEKLNTKKPS